MKSLPFILLFIFNNSFFTSVNNLKTYELAPKRVQVTVITRYIKCLSVDDGHKGSKDGEEIYGNVSVQPGLWCRNLTNYDVEQHMPKNVLGNFGVQWSLPRGRYKAMLKGDVININKVIQYDIPLPIPCGLSREQFAVTLTSNLDEYDGGGNDDDDLLEGYCKHKECSTRWPQMIDVVNKPYKEEIEHIHSSGGTKVIVKFSVTCSPVYN
jgi:hypothetical protein